MGGFALRSPHAAASKASFFFYPVFKQAAILRKFLHAREEMARAAAGETRSLPLTPFPPAVPSATATQSVLSPAAADLGVTPRFNLARNPLGLISLTARDSGERRIRACAERRQVANTEGQTKTRLRQAPPPRNVGGRRRLPSRGLAKLQTNSCVSLPLSQQVLQIFANHALRAPV